MLTYNCPCGTLPHVKKVQECFEKHIKFLKYLWDMLDSLFKQDPISQLTGLTTAHLEPMPSQVTTLLVARGYHIQY